jgi:hypothetical protein
VFLMPPRKTHCKHGHSLAGAPKRPDRPNARRCLICQSNANRQHYMKRKLGADAEAMEKIADDRQHARIHGPNRESILAAKRSHYHRNKRQKVCAGGIGLYFALAYRQSSDA